MPGSHYGSRVVSNLLALTGAHRQWPGDLGGKHLAYRLQQIAIAGQFDADEITVHKARHAKHTQSGPKRQQVTHEAGCGYARHVYIGEYKVHGDMPSG